jgi:hypothetical protein
MSKRSAEPGSGNFFRVQGSGLRKIARILGVKKLNKKILAGC